MTSFSPPKRRLFSALLALWLVLCAVAVCAVSPDMVAGDSAAALLNSSGDFSAQDHCASDDGDRRCDDRRASEHRGLADILPLLALFALPFFYLPRHNHIRAPRRRRPAPRRSLRLHLWNCVQLN